MINDIDWQKWRLLKERASPRSESEIETSEEVVTTIKLPKLRISEQWGEPGSKDREIIEMFTQKISGTTFQQKISSLQAFVKDCDESCVEAKDVSEILGSLIFLDALSSVIYDFNATTSGFLFEALTSALLGGKARQVPTTGGVDQDVIDIYDEAGQPLSLKFFKSSGSGYIHGSLKNLKASLEKERRPIIYLIGIKNTEGKDTLSLDFYQFTVGLTPYENSKLPKEERIKGNYTYKQVGSDKGIRTSAIIGTAKSRVKSGGYHVAALNFGSRDEIAKVAAKYVDKLGSVLLGIYENLDDLSKNVNQYFLSSPDNKKDYIDAAQQSATELRKKTEELD